MMMRLCSVMFIALVLLAFATATQAQLVFQWGGPGDIPMPADWDGDGVGDLAVYRPSTGQWFFALSNFGGAFLFRTAQWGTPTDVPIAFPIGVIANTEGSLSPDPDIDLLSQGHFLAVYRPSTGQWFVLPVAISDLNPF